MPNNTLTIQMREARLIIDRILLANGAAKGMLSAIRNAIIASEYIGDEGFRRLNETAAAIDWSAMAIDVGGSTEASLHVDCKNVHAWIAAPSLLDLAVAECRMKQEAVISVVNVASVEQLSCLAALAHQYGVHLFIDINGGPASHWALTAQGNQTGYILNPASDDAGLKAPIKDTATIIAINSPKSSHDGAGDITKTRILHDGFVVEAELWWQLYAQSKYALSIDTVLSRRHAGTVIVQEDGTVIGGDFDDDESDLRYLSEELSEENEQQKTA